VEKEASVHISNLKLHAEPEEKSAAGKGRKRNVNLNGWKRVAHVETAREI